MFSQNTLGGSSKSLGNGGNGVDIENTTGITFANNDVKYNAFNGILMGSGTHGNTIANNNFLHNNQANNSAYFDANDQSGTATTVLNSWSNNTIGTKNKSVIS
jgi:hypothetical protein